MRDTGQPERTTKLKPAEPSSAEPPSPLEFANQFCPVCSRRLESHRCKMVCRKCGYFMSCSEFE